MAKVSVKILAVTNLYPPHYLGGYELICYQVVRGLRARGHDVPVLTSDHVVNEALGLPEEPDVERSLKIHGFYGHPWRGLWRLRLLERHNNTVLRDAIQRHRPDVVFVWNMGGLSKSMLFTLQSLRVPTAFYISDHWIERGLSTDVWLRWWNHKNVSVRQRCLRFVLEGAGARKRWSALAPTHPPAALRFQKIAFCSAALRSNAVKAGYGVAHGAVIYPPVDTTRFDGPPGGCRGPVQRLLFVGRLAPDKGVMTALQALARVRGKFRGELNLYGRGDAKYVAELKRFVAEHQLRVSFLSAHLDQMPEIYRAHDVLIFPSEWEEPFALTPLEAMASGLPVVGTLTGGSAELFRHGENALTFTAGNVEELAGRILEFVSDHDLRERCATTGFCEVRRRFAAPVMLGRIEEFLAS